MNPSRIKLEALLRKLNLGHEWCLRNRHNQLASDELYSRTSQIFEELELFGINPSTSLAFYVLGVEITDELLTFYETSEASDP